MERYDEIVREFIWTSFELQLLASVAVVAAFLIAVRLVRGLRPVLGRRYTANFAEAVEMTVMAIGVLIVAYLLADIWMLSFVVDQTVDDVLVGRWIFVRATISVAVVVSGYLLIRVINRIIDSLRKEEVITQHQKEVAYHIFDGAIVVVAGLVVLSAWGDNPTNLIISAGVLTAVLGLAARQTVAAVIAGFAMLVTRPFRAGDWIRVADTSENSTSGIVQDITLLYTKVRTFNDEHVFLPNHKLTAHQLTNYTRNDRLRIDIEVDVDYATDLDHARDVIRETGTTLDDASSVKAPRAVLKRFDDSAIVVELQFWIENPTRSRVWNAQSDAIAALKSAFDREDITIPFPQRTHRPREESGFRVDHSERAADVVESSAED